MRELRVLGGLLTVVVAITMLFTLAVNLISLFYSVPMIKSFTSDPANSKYLQWPFFIVVPFRIDLFILDGEMIFFYFIIGVVIISVSTLALLNDGGKFLLRSIRNLEEGWKKGPISDFVELISITLFVSVIMVLILELVGVSPITPPLEELPIEVQMYSLEFASFHEEIITRVLLIGVPLSLYYIVKKKYLMAPRIILGGFSKHRKLNDIEISLLVLSSSIFSIAHVFGGWGLWKMLPTLVAGIAFGYLYMKYGLHYSIAAHFFIDYLMISLWFLEKYKYMITLILLFGLMFLMWVIAGGIYISKYSMKLLNAFIKRDSKQFQQHHQCYFHRMKCPICHYSIFRYLPNGYVICANCGFRIYPPPDPPPWFFEYSGKEVKYPPPPPFLK